MWHEARKQEKKIRCMLVDYQRRAQRRKDYYDKIKSDPTQFLQLHGRSCKIHLDPAVSIAANSSATMMPWQGNPAIMIDRFDARAHLDHIPEVTNREEPDEELTPDERQTNYERYRILVQNDFFNIPEVKFLNQIHLEEKFGSSLKNTEETNSSKKRSTVAIGYNYDEDEANVSSPIDKGRNNVPPANSASENVDDDDDSEEDFDLDLTVDVSKIETQQANELNTCAHAYGMTTNDFFSFLNNDLEEAENLRIAREREEEKAMFSGRKSRKERRAYRERNFIYRKLSPPSYAWKKSPSYEDYKALVSSNRSRSKSASPVNSGKITYITSFGSDEPVTSSSLSSRDVGRKKISRSRSGSRDVERSKRARRSRSASAEHRRLLNRWKTSRSSSRDKSRSKRSESRSSPHTQSRSIPETSLAASHKTSLDNDSNSASIPRYYGRRKEESSSELSLSSDEESKKQNRTDKSKSYQVSGPCRVAASNKNSSSDKLTPQERLRRKRQVMLNKQFKADKRAEREKTLKQVQERIERAEEMKEISIRLRRRQRKLRHNDSPRRHSSGSRSSSSDRSSASKSSSDRRQSKHRSKRRDRSSDDGSSTDSSSNRDDSRRAYKKKRGNTSRSLSSSRSRSYDRRSRSRSRQRSRSPRRGRYSEERSTKRTNTREYDRDSNTRRYCTLSEERELARVHSENSDRQTNDRRDYKNDYKSRRERSPLRGRLNIDGSSETRDRTRENDRRGDVSRSSFGSRRSPYRDHYSSRYDG